MDKQQIKQHIAANIQRALTDGLDMVRDEKLRERVNRATEAIYALFESHGIKPDDTAMTLTHSESRQIAGETKLKWHEHDYPNLTFEETIFENGNPVYGDAKLRPEVEAWLNENCRWGWKVDFDRGDFGDGAIVAELHFPNLEVAKQFMTAWGIRG